METKHFLQLVRIQRYTDKVVKNTIQKKRRFCKLQISRLYMYYAQIQESGHMFRLFVVQSRITTLIRHLFTYSYTLTLMEITIKENDKMIFFINGAFFMSQFLGKLDDCCSSSSRWAQSFKIFFKSMHIHLIYIVISA